jgi:hypothetical protein
MAQDRPDAAELLDTVREFLEELLRSLTGDARFKTRVSAHLLGILAREWRDEPDLATAERTRLRDLLGRADGELAELNQELAHRIRAGSLDAGDPALFAHVLRSVEDKVRIVNPKYLGSTEK